MLADVALQDAPPVMKKQYSTPNLMVGTVKKSIAAITS
jgi:hypothetical protein